MTSLENNSTDLVLAAPAQPVLANTEVYSHSFPAMSVQNVTALALERYRQKKADETERQKEMSPKIQEQEARRQEALEKALENPQTLRELLINIMINNRGEIKKRIIEAQYDSDFTKMSVADRTLYKGVFPILTEKFVLDVPANALEDRLTNRELSDMETFILKHLEKYLISIRDQMVEPYTGSGNLLEGDAKYILYQLGRHCYNYQQPHGKVTLNDIWKWLQSSFIMTSNGDYVLSWIRNNHNGIYYRVCQNGFVKRTKSIVKESHNHILGYLLGSLDIHRLKNTSVDAALDDAIDQLLPFVDQAGTEDTINEINPVPTFENLQNLRAQLEINIKRLATQGKVKKALGEHLFPDDRIAKFQQEYQELPEKFRLGDTKKKVNKKLKEDTNPAIEKDIETLISILDFCMSVHTRANLLKVNGATESQKKEAELLYEVVQVYADFLSQIGVELESKIAIPNLEIPDLHAVTETMAEFGAAGERVVKIAREVLQNFQMAQEAAKETEDSLS